MSYNEEIVSLAFIVNLSEVSCAPVLITWTPTKTHVVIGIVRLPFSYDWLMKGII